MTSPTTTTNATIQLILVAALAGAALLVVLVAFAGWTLHAPAYDPGLVPTSEPQVPPMARPGTVTVTP